VNGPLVEPLRLGKVLPSALNARQSLVEQDAARQLLDAMIVPMANSPSCARRVGVELAEQERLALACRRRDRHAVLEAQLHAVHLEARNRGS